MSLYLKILIKIPNNEKMRQNILHFDFKLLGKLPRVKDNLVKLYVLTIN